MDSLKADPHHNNYCKY